jgi:hypothetical protein
MAEGRASSEEGTFKGWPIITIYTGRSYKGEEEKVVLGVRKAAAVDDCIDAIRIFVDKNRGKEK